MLSDNHTKDIQKKMMRPRGNVPAYWLIKWL
jgi:hypothetical protein